MGVALHLITGAVIGALARAIFPQWAPTRTHVAMILATVGSVLGGLAGSVADIAGILTVSPGAAVRAVTGAMLILLAFAVLPKFAPGVLPSPRSAPRG